MKKINEHIPDAELDIMRLLWQFDRPARVSDIYWGLRDIRPCSKPAIHTLLERLAKRGFVHLETVEGSIPYKLITPLVEEADYRASQSETFLEKLCRGKWQTLVATLVDTGKISDKDLDEISELLKAKPNDK